MSGKENLMDEIASGTGVDVVRILEICRDVEVYVSELYYYFEESFSDIPDMSRLWKKTAMEEENHAKQFVLAINLRKQDLVHSVSIDLDGAEAVLNKVKSVYETVRQSKPAIADALRMAIELEEELAEYHLSVLARFQDKSHKMLFEAMMNHDNGHALELIKAYQNVMASQ